MAKQVQLWKSLKARMLIALTIDALVVLPMWLHNTETWFGRRVPLGPQLAFAVLVAIATFICALRTYLRFTTEAEESFMAAMNEQHAGIEKALALVSWRNDDATRPGEFELAYQVRVAIDCIRFAIKATEQSVEEPNEIRQASLRQEANFQLIDAIDRLQSAERRFQGTFRFHSSDATFGMGQEVPCRVEERVREAGS